MIKKWKKLEENCIFFIFRKIFGALEAKMMKNDKKMKKKWKKNEKKMKKLRENCNFSFFGKLQFSSSLFFICFSFFFSFFYHFSSFFIIFHRFHHWKQKWLKNDKKMIKKWKKLEENCIFFIFRKIFGALEAKMMKNDKKMKKKWKKNEKKMKKTEGKLQFFIFWKIAIFLEFVFHFFFIFFSFFIIFHHLSSIPPLEAKMIKKW